MDEVNGDAGETRSHPTLLSTSLSIQFRKRTLFFLEKEKLPVSIFLLWAFGREPAFRGYLLLNGVRLQRETDDGGAATRKNLGEGDLSRPPRGSFFWTFKKLAERFRAIYFPRKNNNNNNNKSLLSICIFFLQFFSSSFSLNRESLLWLEPYRFEWVIARK